MKKNKISIYSNIPIIKEGLNNIIINEYNQISFISGGLDALIEGIKNYQPEIVILDDYELYKNNSENFYSFIENINEITKIIVFTDNKNPEYLMNLIMYDASGIIHKTSKIEDIFLSINKVFSGDIYIDEITIQIINNDIKFYSNPVLTNLGVREKEILKLVLRGKTNIEISKLLYISSKTVENHKENIKRKLGFSNTKELFNLQIS